MKAAKIELHCVVVDPGEQRTRWNGDPMASREVTEAVIAAVDVFEASLKAQGIQVARTGYGVTAA